MSYQPVRAQTPAPQTSLRSWGYEVLLAETPDYTLKRLTYWGGRGGGLQYHTRKDESFYIESGDAVVTIDDGEGNLIQIKAGPGSCFRIPPGAVHKFLAVTDCVVFEASTAVKDDRVRMERFFGQPVPTGNDELPSTSPEPE